MSKDWRRWHPGGERFAPINLPGSQTQQPRWRFLGNLGDADPLGFGGYFIYEDTTGVYGAEAEVLIVDDEDAELEETTYTIHRILLERLKVVDGYLVPYRYQRNWPHPVEWYDEWFHNDLKSIASFVDIDVDELRDLFTSENPMERAQGYRMLGDYHGWHEFDQDPLTDIPYEEAERRYQLELRSRR